MEELRQKAAILHPEVRFVDRTDMIENLNKPRTTLPILFCYEWTAVLSARKTQLENGARPMISLDDIDPNDPRFIDKVAKQEIIEKKLPFLWIRRRMPDKTNEFWCLSELEVIW